MATIYYGVVAKNKYVVADYTKFDGDFPAIFQQIINTTPATNKVTVLSRGDQAYYVRPNTDGYVFGCMASSLTPNEVPRKFLEELQARVYAYVDRQGQGKSAAPSSTAAVFTRLIREIMVLLLLLSSYICGRKTQRKRSRGTNSRRSTATYAR
ncbi:MAG: hypothetical protein P4M11_04675 [Candidatus Pacebacteria bacterium]|nr:hypothetical protein [Candidatus Paceibacterota bacterium]